MHPYQNTALSPEERARDLLKLLKLEKRSRSSAASGRTKC